MDIKKLRKKLKINQSDLALILGIHPITVSKWERGVLSPSPYHLALLEKFNLSEYEHSKIELLKYGAVETLTTLLYMATIRQ